MKHVMLDCLKAAVKFTKPLVSDTAGIQGLNLEENAAEAAMSSYVSLLAQFQKTQPLKSSMKITFVFELNPLGWKILKGQHFFIELCSLMFYIKLLKPLAINFSIKTINVLNVFLSLIIVFLKNAILLSFLRHYSAQFILNRLVKRFEKTSHHLKKIVSFQTQVKQK